MPVAVGVPLIVNTPPAKLPVTPDGNPVTPAPVALPPTLYVIVFIDVPTHLLCTFVPADDVNDIDAFSLTVNVYVAIAATHGLPFGLFVVTVIVTTLPASAVVGVYVKLNGELVEVLIFNEPAPFSVILTFVALPPNVLLLTVTALLLHVVPLVLDKLTLGGLVHPQLFTVILPVKLACVQPPPVVVTV